MALKLQRIFKFLLKYWQVNLFVSLFTFVRFLEHEPTSESADPTAVKTLEFTLHTLVLVLGVYNLVFNYLSHILIENVKYARATRHRLHRALVWFGCISMLAYPIGRGAFGALPPTAEPFIMLFAIYTCFGLLLVLLAWSTVFECLWRGLVFLTFLSPAVGAVLMRAGLLCPEAELVPATRRSCGQLWWAVGCGQPLKRDPGPLPAVSTRPDSASDETAFAGLRKRLSVDPLPSPGTDTDTETESDSDTASSTPMKPTWLLGDLPPRVSYMPRKPVWTSQFPLLLSLATSVAGVYNAYQDPVVVHVTVPLARLPPALHGFTFAQLSDVHAGPTVGAGRVRRLVDIVNSLDADAVVLTGDFWDGHHDTYREALQPLAGLQVRAPGKAQSGPIDSRKPVFFVSGNHEYYDGVYSRKVAGLRELGIHVLQNERVRIPLQGQLYTARKVHERTEESVLHRAMDSAAQAVRYAAGASATARRMPSEEGQEVLVQPTGVARSVSASTPASIDDDSEEDATFDLAGVTDWAASALAGTGHAANISHALHGRDPTRELVLLAHQPKQIFLAGLAGVGLQISGHVHGGQIAPYQLPVYMGNPYFAGLYQHWTPVAASQAQEESGAHAEAQKHVEGLLGDNLSMYKSAQPDSPPSWLTWIYVSRGSWYWGPPLRLGAQHEVTLITLTALRAKGEAGEQGPTTRVYPAALAGRVLRHAGGALR